MLTSAPPLLGSTTPRIWTPPQVRGAPGPCGCGCALTPETSLGFSVLDFSEQVLGIVPLPWQRWLLIHALELRPDGLFRFRTVLILVARQNGKTTIIEVKNLWKMFVLEIPLVIGTAQDLDTAEESWDKAVEICEAVPELADEIRHVDKTNGKKALRLTNGSRWKIKAVGGAAARRAGRGLSGDDVNLDELREHQSWLAWGAVTKTTMARRNAQVYAFSNAGDDSSVVLNDLQKKGRAAAERPSVSGMAMGFFEWSAPDDVKCTCGRPEDRHTPDCRLQDRAVWAQANPSLGYTVTEEALANALDTDPEEVFRTECLCQRVPSMKPQWAVISQQQWEATADSTSTALDPVAFAVDVTPDRSAASIAIAGVREDGLLHVELVDHRPGTGWVVDRVKTLIERWSPCAVALDPSGPAGSLIVDFDEAGIELAKPKAREAAGAAGQFYDAIVPPPEGNVVAPLEDGEETVKEWASALRHVPHPALSIALSGATKRSLGDAFMWNRSSSAIDISPLIAVTLAAWAFATRPPVEEESEPWAAWT